MRNEKAIKMLRLQMMALSDAIAPLHEWIAGERNYFLSQGYTEPEARAMAAATYVAAVGANIYPGKPDPDEGGDT